MSDNYEPIYKVVRAKMRKTLEQLPDDDETMVEDTGIVVPFLLGKIRSGGNPAGYTALTADQKRMFDGAAGRIVAARIRPSFLAAGDLDSGVVVESEVGGVKRRYAGYFGTRTPGSVGNKSLEEQWIEQAELLIAELVATFRPPTKCKTTAGSFYGLPGRRRAEEQRSGVRAIELRELLPITALYTDRRRNYE